MTSRSQREFLKVQLLETRRLKEMAGGHPLMSVAFAEREEELNQQLSELPYGLLEARSVLFFSGEPVLGSVGIDAGFAARVLEPFQNMVMADYADRWHGVVGSRGRRTGETQSRLLLTGVIVAAGCGAIVALILSIAPDHKLHGMLFWLMGDLSQATNPHLALGVLAAVLAIAMPFARELNLLTRGADLAQSLGVQVGRLRRGVYLVASLATAAAVTQAGSIGFIGLIVPHLVRLAAGNDQRLLLPASALAGGSLLVIADTLARTVIAPQQLPVGVLTALIGVPVFLFLLARDARRRG